MHNNVTLLVNSCDKYEDAWHPFFEMLHIYGGEFPYPIVLNTETQNYASPYFNIRVINSHGKMTWSERLKNVVSQINTEYIFLLLEDYFLKAPFDYDRFQIVLDYMDNHPDVGFLDIAPRYAASPEEALRNQKLIDIDDEFYVRDNDKFNITVVPSIWRRDFLLNLIRDHEDVWAFEYYSGIRARQTGMKVVRYITRTPTIYEYDFQVWTGIGITRGQWLPQNVEFFAKHGVSVNFENLGILHVNSLQEIKKLNRKSPRVMIKSVKRRIHDTINRRKSLK